MINLRERLLTVIRVLDTDPKDWVIEESVVKDPPASGFRCRARVIPPSGAYSDLLHITCWAPTPEKAADDVWDTFTEKVDNMVLRRREALTLATERMARAYAAQREAHALNHSP